MRPRILHAPIHALYQPSLMVNGLGQHGYNADLMVLNDHFEMFSFPVDREICINDDSDELSINRLCFLAGAIPLYDVFHFHSGYSLLPSSYNCADLRILKKLGKIIVMSRWGCRDGNLPSSFNERTGLCEFCPIKTSCTDEALRERLIREEKYIDLIINHEPDFESYNRNAFYMPAFIDIDFWHPDLQIPSCVKKEIPRNNGEINIIHAVGGCNRGDVKGSSVINEIITELQNDYKINYYSISGKSFKDLRYYILQSDIVIDQLRYGSFGSFARESMSLGKMVIGHVREEQRQVFGDKFPIVEATVDTLLFVLKKYLNNPSLVIEAGKSSRLYAENELNHIKLSKQLAGIYNDLLSGKLDKRITK